MEDNKEKKHEKSLEKMRFYDTNFKVLGASILLMIVSSYLLKYLPESIGDIDFLFALIAIIPFLSINWGMFYHQFKSGSYGWFSITIILLIVGLAPIALMTFYFVKMRKEFLNGGGVYS